MPPIAVNFLRLMNFNPSVFGVNAESTSPKVEAIYAPLFIRAKIRRRCVGTPPYEVRFHVLMPPIAVNFCV